MEVWKRSTLKVIEKIKIEHDGDGFIERETPKDKSKPNGFDEIICGLMWKYPGRRG